LAIDNFHDYQVDFRPEGSSAIVPGAATRPRDDDEPAIGDARLFQPGFFGAHEKLSVPLDIDLPNGFAATLPHLPLEGEPVALVCAGSSCQPPVRTAAALAETWTPATSPPASHG
jgi:hypothetical protein